LPSSEADAVPQAAWRLINMSDTGGTRQVGPAVAVGVALPVVALAVELPRPALTLWQDPELPAPLVAQSPVPVAVTLELSALAVEPAPVRPSMLRAESETNPPFAVNVYVPDGDAAPLPVDSATAAATASAPAATARREPLIAIPLSHVPCPEHRSFGGETGEPGESCAAPIFSSEWPVRGAIGRVTPPNAGSRLAALPRTL
jgi:hypothetical protein